MRQSMATTATTFNGTLSFLNGANASMIFSVAGDDTKSIFQQVLEDLSSGFSMSTSYSSRSIRLITWSLLVNLLVHHASAYSSYGGGNSLMGNGGGYGGSGGGSSKGPYTAAVETSRTVEVKPVQSTNEQYEPHVVEVPGDDSPVIVHFKSQSSRVLIQQTHTPAVIGEPEHTTSEDEPQRVIHEVLKPVIQEIKEVVQPYRRVVQTIQPVIETTHTIIAKGEPRPAIEPLSVPGASGGNSGSGSSGSGRGSGSYGGSGGSGGYAAAASTSVSLKSAPSSKPATTTESRSQSVSHQVTSSSSSYHQPQPQHSNSNNRKYTNAQIQQIFQQSAQQPSSGSSQYSARRGDIRESQYSQPQQQQQATQTRISLKPAPAGFNGGYYRKPNVQAVYHQPQQEQQQFQQQSQPQEQQFYQQSRPQEQQQFQQQPQPQEQQFYQQTRPQEQQQFQQQSRPQEEQFYQHRPQEQQQYQHQPQEQQFYQARPQEQHQFQQNLQQQQSIQQVLSHIQPMTEVQGPKYYAYSDYQGAVSSLHEDDMPMLTFVAKPTRFRARARAA